MVRGVSASSLDTTGNSFSILTLEKGKVSTCFMLLYIFIGWLRSVEGRTSDGLRRPHIVFTESPLMSLTTRESKAFLAEAEVTARPPLYSLHQYAQMLVLCSVRGCLALSRLRDWRRDSGWLMPKTIAATALQWCGNAKSE